MLFVAFSNADATTTEVLGRKQRGAPGGRGFDARTGQGFVSEQKGQYTRALDLGYDVRLLLFSTFGGWHSDAVDLLRDLAEYRQNKLEYDATTWSARTWTSFSVQKVSVALHHAVALETAHALGLPASVDGRGRGALAA